jgi:hypothetical protein
MNHPQPVDDAQLPTVVRTYLAAHDREDVEHTLSTFTADARVYDEDREYRGIEQIRAWLTATSAAFTFTRTLTGAQRLDDSTWLLQNRLEGDFPGGVADLRYRFALADDRIADLAITP